MSGFHIKDSWYFRREPDGSVRIHWGERDKVGVTLSPADWTSVVAAMCADGVNPETYEAVGRLHQGGTE